MKQEQKTHVSADALIQLLKGAKSIRWQLALGVVMSLVLVVCALVIPTQMGALVQILIDYFDAPETGASVLAQLAPGLLALAGVYLLRAAISYGKMQLLNRAVSRYFTCNLRIQISDKIQRLPVSFVDHTPVGDILSRMTEDVSRIGGSLHTVLDTITGGFLQILAIAVVMFLQNWQLSLAVIAFMPVSIWLSAKIAGRSETYFHQMFKQSGELYSVVEEAYTNYATTKAYNLEEHCAERHARINDARRVPMSKTLSIIDTGELIDLIGQLRIVLPHTVVQARPAGDVREVVEDAEVTQGKLSLGFRTGGASLIGGEPAAYWMFQTIYGGSTSAKLFLNVREKKSLCYYASAQFVASKGLMIVNSGIENKNFEVARDEILHQLDLCRKGEITDAELESARKTLVNGWRMLDDPLTLERYWMGQAAAGTLVSPDERIEQVTDITREQVIAAAQSTALDTVFFMKGAAK